MSDYGFCRPEVDSRAQTAVNRAGLGRYYRCTLWARCRLREEQVPPPLRSLRSTSAGMTEFWVEFLVRALEPYHQPYARLGHVSLLACEETG